MAQARRHNPVGRRDVPRGARSKREDPVLRRDRRRYFETKGDGRRPRAGEGPVRATLLGVARSGCPLRQRRSDPPHQRNLQPAVRLRGGGGARGEHRSPADVLRGSQPAGNIHHEARQARRAGRGGDDSAAEGRPDRPRLRSWPADPLGRPPGRRLRNLSRHQCPEGRRERAP